MRRCTTTGRAQRVENWQRLQVVMNQRFALVCTYQSLGFEGLLVIKWSRQTVLTARGAGKLRSRLQERPTLLQDSRVVATGMDNSVCYQVGWHCVQVNQSN